MKQYRLKNRRRLTEYQKEYLKRSGRKYHNDSGNKELNYLLLDDAGKGRFFELKALKLLVGSMDENKSGFNKKSWDISWKGKKIDVKMKNIPSSPNNKWCFNISENEEVDSFFFFCCRKDKVEKVLLIPRFEVKDKKTIAIGVESKWDKYIFQTKTSL